MNSILRASLMTFNPLYPRLRTLVQPIHFIEVKNTVASYLSTVTRGNGKVKIRTLVS